MFIQRLAGSIQEAAIPFAKLRKRLLCAAVQLLCVALAKKSCPIRRSRCVTLSFMYCIRTLFTAHSRRRAEQN